MQASSPARTSRHLQARTPAVQSAQHGRGCACAHRGSCANRLSHRHARFFVRRRFLGYRKRSWFVGRTALTCAARATTEASRFHLPEQAAELPVSVSLRPGLPNPIVTRAPRPKGSCSRPIDEVRGERGYRLQTTGHRYEGLRTLARPVACSLQSVASHVVCSLAAQRRRTGMLSAIMAVL